MWLKIEKREMFTSIPPKFSVHLPKIFFWFRIQYIPVHDNMSCQIGFSDFDSVRYTLVCMVKVPGNGLNFSNMHYRSIKLVPRHYKIVPLYAY